MLIEDEGFEGRWESEEQEGTAGARRQKKIDDYGKLKQGALIAVDFSVNMVRCNACLLFGLCSNA